MTHTRCALGVDLGTGSARAFLFDTAGVRQSGVRLPCSWRVGADGAVEADADAIVQLVCTAIDGALDGAPAHSHIAAVGFSALWHTLLGVDSSGRAVTPALAWNDTRATMAAHALRQRLDERAVHQRTGAMLHPSYPPARIAWLRDSAPALYARVHRWLSLPEYLWLKLTGSTAVDVSIAAGSGLLDRHSLQWDAELLDAIGLDPSRLGCIAFDDDAARHGRTIPATDRWPRLRHASWRLPVGDGACANIGSGCLDASRIALSIGTSAAVRVTAPRSGSPLPRGLWCYPLGRSHMLLGGAISNGGLVRSWLRATLRLPADDAELDALLLSRPAAAHGLSMLPFLAGERSPDWPLDVTGSIHGLRAATSALDVFQAGLESVAYRLDSVRRLLLQAVPTATAVVASGGAVQASPYWVRLLADTFGTPIQLCSDAETSSRGAALLALLAAGDYHSLADLPAAATRTIQPDPDAHAAHAAARHDFHPPQG